NHRLVVRHSADHSSSDSSSDASLDFHSDASSDSSLRHSLSDHSSPDLPSTSVGTSRKRRRSPMTYVPALSPVSGEISLRDDAIAEIDECIAYVDALRDRGIDARVVVEAIDRDQTETGVRGPVEVRVERVTHPMMPEDIPEPAYMRHWEIWIVGVESAVIALTKRIAELERDNMRLRGTASVERFPKMPNTRSGASMTHEEFEELVNRRVAEEMEAHEAARTLEPLNENVDEQEGENGGNGNGGNGGIRNGGNGENGNGNRNGNHKLKALSD
ncbi:hypothetical protein Tco_0915156, partial [Tanacetum coccineum]